MEPTEPTPPEGVPTSPPPPPVQWAPPPAMPPPASNGSGTGALFKDRPASSLTLGDAISTGFGVVAKPTFIIPLLILAVIVNVVLSIVFAPLTAQFGTPGTTPTFTPEQMSKLLSGFAVAFIVSIIAGIIINVYGLVWAAAASSGPIPSIGRTLQLAGSRWVGIVGVGLLVGVILIGLLVAFVIVVSLVFAALGSVGWLFVVAGGVFYIWVTARLSMAGWLAAEGGSVSNSFNGSWAVTRGNVLRIIGWSLGYGFVFGLIGLVLGLLLGLVPLIGAGIAQAIQVALGYGAGVTLFRRTQAGAVGSPMAPGEPAVQATA